MDTIDLTDVLTADLKPPITPIPGVLAIAGSDCSGGAGLEADMKTITVLGCYAMTCITALTAQNSKGVHKVSPTSPETLQKILGALQDDDLNLQAVKVGLLPESCVPPVASFLDKLASDGFDKIVMDPVLMANNGDSLGDSQTPALISLFKHCRLVTPNFAEAEILRSHVLGFSKVEHVEITGVDTLGDLAKTIGQKTGTSVLVKGGHIPFDAAGEHVDLKNPKLMFNVLYDYTSKSTHVFKCNYVNSSNTHGTGCTMSSYIASSLAKGLSLQESVENSIVFLCEAIRRAVPKKNGPVNHIWQHSSASPQNLLHLLVTDPKINPIWEEFTSHAFFKSLNNGTLTDSGLRHFLVQDYGYLQCFLACHRRLQELAPNAETKQVMIDATHAVEGELAGHVALLKKKYGIEHPENTKESPALKKYNDFMNHIRETGDFVDLETALIPCQFGFNYAVAKFYKPESKYDTATGEVIQGDTSLQEPCNSEYEYWLEDAVSPAYEVVLRTLQRVYNSAWVDLVHSKNTDIERLKQIFAEGSRLEYEFWDECYKA